MKPEIYFLIFKKKISLGVPSWIGRKPDIPLSHTENSVTKTNSLSIPYVLLCILCKNANVVAEKLPQEQ